MNSLTEFWPAYSTFVFPTGNQYVREQTCVGEYVSAGKEGARVCLYTSRLFCRFSFGLMEGILGATTSAKWQEPVSGK